MAEPKNRSEFAQALYDLMITPEIYPIEEWCAIIDPWVEYKTKKSTVHTFGPEAHGAPKTMALIQSWFDDVALPTSENVQTIIFTCEEGHKAIGMANLFSFGERDSGFDSYLERFKKGREAQEKALDHFYEILDKHIWDVSPLGGKFEEKRVSLYPHHKLGMYEGMIENLISRIYRIPTRNIKSVLWKLIEIAHEAEKNNWYEKTPEK